MAERWQEIEHAYGMEFASLHVISEMMAKRIAELERAASDVVRLYDADMSLVDAIYMLRRALEHAGESGTLESEREASEHLGGGDS
jgi:hypothetical protein